MARSECSNTQNVGALYRYLRPIYGEEQPLPHRIEQYFGRRDIESLLKS